MQMVMSNTRLIIAALVSKIHKCIKYTIMVRKNMRGGDKVILFMDDLT